MIVDDFLNDFKGLNEYARGLDYAGAISPWDGVCYPDVSLDVPEDVRIAVAEKLTDIFQVDIEIDAMFLRLTTVNTSSAPHQAHTDTIMGDFTFLLYLQDGPGGTSLVRHRDSGMDSDPEDPAQQEIWQRDTNVPDAWEMTEMIDMRANRAAIIHADQMHRAEPIGGFGEGPADGRLVLTAFCNFKGGSDGNAFAA